MIIMKLKSTIAAAAIALLPMSAGALTITTDGPIEGGVINLSANDIFTIEINGGSLDSGGSAAFGFVATEALIAVDTNSLNPNDGFADAKVEWNSEADLSGTSYGSISGADLILGKELKVSFSKMQAIWLVASWTDVTREKSNFDLRIEATAVPLPAGILLLGTSLAGFGVMRRRKRA